MKKNKLQYNAIKYKDNTMVLDVETFGTTPRVYENGGAILDKDGKLIYLFSILNVDVLCKREFQDNVYYKDKLPIYFYYMNNNIYNVDFIITDTVGMCEALNDIIHRFNIKLVKGYNIDFDYKAVNRAYSDIQYNRKANKNIPFNSNKVHIKLDYNIIPKKVHNDFKKLNCFDIMQGYTLLLETNKELRLGYEKYCVDNSLYSDSLKNISSREEDVYKYFIDATHEEAHIGFLDVLDEIELDKKLKQFMHTKQYKNTTFLLNEKVNRAVYVNNGLYTLTRVKKELKDCQVI